MEVIMNIEYIKKELNELSNGKLKDIVEQSIYILEKDKYLSYKVLYKKSDFNNGYKRLTKKSKLSIELIELIRQVDEGIIEKYSNDYLYLLNSIYEQI